LKKQMERRKSSRQMCSDFVQIAWSDDRGRRTFNVGLLEDVSPEGISLTLDLPVPAGRRVHLHTKGFAGEAEVCYCELLDYGYLLGLEFADGCCWEPEKWRPKHLYAPPPAPGP
jgi:hypothetical protein